MNTEHILFYPHKEYNTEKEITDNLRNKDYIQYGYIKLRDLNKWLNNEVVSVKMGMLTPSNKSYRGLTILESAIKRIKEQDTTALFDDEDELIPIYVFVSTETDDEWRNYLLSNGFVSSRKNANREGVKIKKSDIGLHYGKHYGYDTKEVLSEKEKQRKREEEQRKREEELKEIQRKEEEEKLKRKKEEYEENKYYFENVLGYGINTYDEYKAKQEEKMQKTNGHFTLDEKTLEIRGYKTISKTTIQYEPLVIGIACILLAIAMFYLTMFYLTIEVDTLLFGGFFFTIIAGLIMSVGIFCCVMASEKVTHTKAIPVHIDANGNDCQLSVWHDFCKNWEEIEPKLKDSAQKLQ